MTGGMNYEWQDHDGDRADIVARRPEWRVGGDAIALLTLGHGDTMDAQVYINADQAKQLEAFFAGLVMSLPAEQRA